MAGIQNEAILCEPNYFERTWIRSVAFSVSAGALEVLVQASSPVQKLGTNSNLPLSRITVPAISSSLEL